MDILMPYGSVISYAGEIQPLEKKDKPLPTELIHPMYPRRHTGWFLCNGASLLKSRYWHLFQALQFIYGKSSDSNKNDLFQLPDYQGEFLRGLLPGNTTDPSNEARTQAAGPDASPNGIGSSQKNMVQMHEHQYQMYPGTNTPGKPEQNSTLAQPKPDFTKGLFTDDTGKTSLSGSETRPRNIYVNYLIYAGLPL